MSNAASGLAHLKPFLPGLGPLLEDAEVSEIMINGPGNVWIETGGRLTAHAAPGLDESALLRAAIHIARPLGLDPATTPIIDAGSMMVPAWQSVFPRPVPTLRSPSGALVSGRSARRIWSSRKPYRKTSWQRRSGC